MTRTYRARLLERHMTDQGLTVHQVATGIGVPMLAVRSALEGRSWFGEREERRLCLYLETARNEFWIE